jgi:signal transduction histidine kinase
MIKPQKPPDEEQRLNALQEYQILATPSEQAYDDITFLASQICETPIAAISLIDSDRQWFKSKVGLDVDETPRDIAFCAHAILDKTKLLVVEDAQQDERFRDNPLVTDKPHIRFYAGAPLVTPGGHPLGTLCVIDSKARALSPAQKHALQILSREVVSLMELRKALRELDLTRRQQLELKDRFLSHVSHELRSPLTVMMQFVSIMLDGLAGEMTPEQKEYLEIVHENALQLHKMIEDLFEITRMQSGKLSVEKRAMDLGELVENVVDSRQLNAREAGVRLDCRLGNALPCAYVDPYRITQVVTNLVENAIKFTPETGSIRINVDRDPDDARMLRVSVADSGCGIDPEDFRRIFERLYQIQNCKESTRKGLGLGLSICHDLVTRHGGKIWVESEIGLGTTFHFTLPEFSVDEWVARFVASLDMGGRELALVRVVLSKNIQNESEGTGPSLIRKARSILEENILNEHLVIPPTICDGGDHALFILGAVESNRHDELTLKVQSLLKNHVGMTGDTFAVETSSELIPIPKGDSESRKVAASLLRLIEDTASCVQ